MKRSLVYIFGVFCMMTACIKEQPEIIIPTPGEGIRFYADLNNVKTKTLYGEENATGTAIKVNWVDGDMISVYGPNCLKGRVQGQYEVTSAVNGSGNSYASNLQMVGDHGVQWGDGNSDFFAVYPSVPDGAFSKNDDDGTISVSTSIRSEQKNVFEKITDDNGVVTWVGTPYVDVTSNNVTTKSQTMPDALMYAYTKGWDDDSETGVKNGETVNLHFTPFATVLKFNLEGWASTLNLQDPTVYIQKITITAPSNVALVGDCVFTFNQGVPVDQGVPVVTEGASTSNVITINPVLEGANFLPLNKKQHVEFNVFAIPLEKQKLSGDWSIKLETTHGSFVFKLNPKDESKASLIAGQIHKINVPELKVKSQFTYEPENWIEAIPRNVYLSELSIPGAWYCTDATYQGNLGFGTSTNISVNGNTVAVDKGLKTLYDSGVRAFHIDCRMSMPTKTEYTGSTNQKSSLRLVCAGTDKVDNNSFTPGDLVKEKIDVISQLAKQKSNEYVVVVLTVAEQELGYRPFITRKIYGTVDPELTLKAIYKMINDNAAIWNVYQNRQEKSENGSSNTIVGIDKDVTVNDVLGKMIVLIHANTSAQNFSTYGTVPALQATASMATSGSGTIVQGDFDSMVSDKPLFWSNSDSKALNYHYHVGQGTRTGGTTDFPLLSSREEAIESVIDQSYTLWEGGNGAHDSWFLLGIGGYMQNYGGALNPADHAELARSLNAYVLNQINQKLSMEDANSTLLPSPIGIVLMNFCTSNNESTSSGNGNGAALVKAIIDMNGKFELVRDPNAEEWPND